MSPHPGVPIASWDFGPCIELLVQGVKSDNTKSPRLNNASSTNIPARNQDVATTRSTPSLGNFDAIFKHLGTEPIDIPIKANYPSSSDETSEDVGSYSTTASTPPDEEPEYFDLCMTPRAVRANEDIQNYKTKLELNNTPQNKPKKVTLPNGAKQLPNNPLSTTELYRQLKVTRTLDSTVPLPSFGWVPDDLPTTPVRRSERIFNKAKKSSAVVDVHATLTHFSTARAAGISTHKSVGRRQSLPADTPRILLDPKVIRPLLYASHDTKKLRIAEKLMLRFGKISSTIEGDLIRAIDHVGGNERPDGIHVFVDSSNIAIGFAEALKRARGMDKNEFTKLPPLAYHSLALIMERGRGVAKRVLVGSSRDNVRLDYMYEAAQCGYEVSALERVEKFKGAKESDIEKYKRLGGANGNNTSSGSGGEAPLNAFKTVTEQGVDEILHMKMLESMVDTEYPSTMVVATGDAAVAEYSSGFLRNVERALERGWKVELVAWKLSMSYAYRDKAFAKKWAKQFTIVELDDFQEELLGIYTKGPRTFDASNFV
ncbi:hypothetical protein VC83_04527 [Pseudogymnoascus destructans]|uniref:NYN domain-containing protein n=2 Tax=Pseudogymnoascus destructans TaxID=655981 RepID=L8G895_PSED2|nr:uncharacterized protein VC83_04527 [Pseudogymnoascus destructans]ELR08231.1 hypothetical protein GMDG_03033 [Pseudogymnoascus destructans 20631-21]OAF57326.1 hypothetical protein VC83_04527 [Pseudogymnoascus destructans]